MKTVYIGLGSNIDAEKNLRSAAMHLKRAFEGIRFSHVYKTKPMELAEQADFHNAAAVFHGILTIEQIFSVLQEIEKQLKKNPPVRYGPRTIDLDLLLYGDVRNEDGPFVIPHPRLHTRRFVLEPLVELGAGDLLHPSKNRPLRDFLAETMAQECEKTSIRL